MLCMELWFEVLKYIFKSKIFPFTVIPKMVNTSFSINYNINMDIPDSTGQEKVQCVM